MAIGKVLPALDSSEIEQTLDKLHQIADRRGFEKFAGLIETNVPPLCELGPSQIAFRMWQ
jgi:hypothetical protein